MGRAVINVSYGGFSVSSAAIDMLEQRGYRIYSNDLYDAMDRHNEDLLEVVETLGDAASGEFSKLRIAEFEGNVYQIDQYDGAESIVTPEDQHWIVIE